MQSESEGEKMKKSNKGFMVGRQLHRQHKPQNYSSPGVRELDLVRYWHLLQEGVTFPELSVSFGVEADPCWGRVLRKRCEVLALESGRCALE